MKRQTRHIPVLLKPVLETLNPRPGQTFVDCTLGLAGHASEILRLIRPAGKIIGIDFDPHNIALAHAKLHALDKAERHFQLFHNNFAAVQTVLLQAGIPHVDGLLADLGVASPQIDDPARGFSYKRAGPLDMRMDPTRGQPASTLINRISERELADAILEYGDETDAPKIARHIIDFRSHTPITTTTQLIEIVCTARDFTLLRAGGAKLHPAARTFQALRILVNREMANLDHLLKILPTLLKPGGIAAIISFHSGEDRRVKHAFRDALRSGLYQEISPDPILGSPAEILANPRARSAKLRWARRSP